MPAFTFAATEKARAAPAPAPVQSAPCRPGWAALRHDGVDAFRIGQNRRRAEQAEGFGAPAAARLSGAELGPTNRSARRSSAAASINRQIAALTIGCEPEATINVSPRVVGCRRRPEHRAWTRSASWPESRPR